MGTGTRQNLIATLSGVLFGMGLVISGMTDPRKVMNFLDLAGTWDPTLPFVLGGALAVSAPLFGLVLRQRAPWIGGKFQMPTRSDIDWRLLVGAAIFGSGWGLSGYCPGPALTSLASFSVSALLVVGALIVGVVLYDRVLDRVLGRR